jgi:hypothetical protein
MPRLADFETSRVARAADRSCSMTRGGGSLGFVAPELHDGRSEQTMATDVFALGRTLLKALEAMAALPEGSGREALASLVQQLTAADAGKRPTVSEALQHPYFTTDAAATMGRLLGDAEERQEAARRAQLQVQAQLQGIYREQQGLQRRDAELRQRRAETERQQREAAAAAHFNEQRSRSVHAAEQRNEREERRIAQQGEKVAADQRKTTAKLAADERKLQEERRALAKRHAMLQRQSEQAEQVPPHWSMNHLKHSTRRVDVTGEMKRQVQELVNNTCIAATLGQGQDQRVHEPYTRLEVVKVTRIESPVVWRVYAAKREAMRAALFRHRLLDVPVRTRAPWMQSELDPAVNEKYLWHGTKPDVVDAIVEHGFDERVAALQGMFGAGVYFAEMSSKSDQYVMRNRSGNFFLFLSRAMLGAAHRTQAPMHNTRRPPVMASIPGRAHDSVVYVPGGNHYSEFIVYDKAQAYPEYLVEFKRR